MARDPHLKATLARARLTSQLYRSDEPAAAALAAVLAACAPATPCWSGACPDCGLAFQAIGAALVDEFIAVPTRAIRNRMTAITVVPASGCVSPNDLAVEDFQRVGSEIKSAFAALDLPTTIIGLEASFNEDTTGRFDDHWCVHAHSIQYEWPSEDQKTALSAKFPRSPLVRRPVKCVPLDQRSEGRLYPFKFERFRRVTVLVTDHPTRAPNRKPKARGLRPSQAVGLALVEHRLGFSGRLLTHGIDERCVRHRLEPVGWARDGP